MTENTTASGAADLLRAAITRAFNLGQTYCQQADSESYAEQGKPDITYKKYKALLDETCTPPLAECAPVAPTPPDWRELCRRLYVELFHCDKQMTCSLNEDGEPIWRTGPEVRDVLSDAKAALEANPK